MALKALRIFPLLVLLLLPAACAQYEWAQSEARGILLEQAEAECRAQAWKNAGKMRPFGNWYEPGPSGEPPESPRELEEREYNLCMRGKGFSLERVKWFN